jgi:hypothetical protein
VSDTSHYNIMYSHKGARYSPLQSKVVIKVSDTFHYNISYSHKGERYSPLQSNVVIKVNDSLHYNVYLRLQWRVSLTFMTVSKIVMERINHLYDCTLDCNGEYCSPF